VRGSGICNGNLKLFIASPGGSAAEAPVSQPNALAWQAREYWFFQREFRPTFSIARVRIIASFDCGQPLESQKLKMPPIQHKEESEPENAPPAGDTLPCQIHFFAFRVTGLFSVCSQLWEGKNAKVFPLLSVSSQLWEIHGQGTECEQKSAEY
jgi:hypothetical protein